ncbi:CHAT domain-containing protein, partial [Leptolyngbya cf. ectocarpi LEGE 11479]
EEGETPSEDNLREARQVLESLQLAELDNFFREACLQVNNVELDDLIDDTTAIIYPIVLPDRIEIIVSFAKTISRHVTYITETELDNTIGTWKSGALDPISDIPEPGTEAGSLSNFRQSSQRLYEWLIAPLETSLNRAGIDTLVFVLDGNLRNISMSALYDGQHYLVEKYAVALTPGLQLLDPKPIARGKIAAFLAGISEAQQGFIGLDGVTTELANIKKIVPSNTLLNEQVTNEALEQGIATSSAPIVHIATHGQFGENSDSTFIVTWGNKLKVDRLSQLLQTSELSRRSELELLILSACKTAAGSNRAVLGLAGVATRSGARSTLATLWPVNDTSTTELMSEFYRQLLNADFNKAKALQQAQLAVLRNPNTSHPHFWSPFILLGNWL